MAIAASTALAALAQAATITTTYHHPFYDITQSAFVDADHLKAGDVLQSTGGATVQITSVSGTERRADGVTVPTGIGGPADVLPALTPRGDQRTRSRR